MNDAEVEVVNNLVKGLLKSRRSKKSDLCDDWVSNVGGVTHSVNDADLKIYFSHAAQMKVLERWAKQNGWDDINRVLTIDSPQGSEYEVVILSLVTTRGRRMWFLFSIIMLSLMIDLAGFRRDRSRANVGASRQCEAIYIVGQARYWFAPPQSCKTYIHSIPKHMRDNARENNRPAFIMESQD